MTRALRRTAVAMFLLFGALFLNLNYVQVVQSDDLSEDPRNSRTLLREYEVARGLMLAGDDETVLAESEETDGQLRFQRRYPEAGDYAHLTGYVAVNYGLTELEQSFNDELAGRAQEAFGRNVADILAGRERTGDDLALTIDPTVQQAALDALDGRPGAAVAIDPRSGAILALASTPTFDPNRLADHDREAAAQAWEELNEDPDRPLINRAAREWWPPGSTFKLVTAAAGLEQGISPSATYDDPVRLELPQTTATIGNFGGGPCVDGDQITVTTAMEVSCNTTFAEMAMEVGDDALIEQAERFGFNAEPLEQLANPLASRFPTELNEPQTAQTGIGEFDVRATPLQMAQVAAAIGNGGVLMEPRVVEAVRDERGATLAQHPAQPFVPPGQDSSQAISSSTASALRAMMIDVVDEGTGTNAQIDGVDVAGKTGTAQAREDESAPTPWFAGFAPAVNPEVAVAVVFEDGGGAGAGATGGSVGAPAARTIMQAALAD